MTRTISNKVALGTLAPNFYLKDTNSSEWFSFQDIKGEKGTLVVFICNHCPFVHHAIDGVVYNRTINPDQKPSQGCNIKWK